MFSKLVRSARHGCRNIERLVALAEELLREKRQIVYGGQAIHMAMLLQGERLYEEHELPDYDVLTPTNYTDAQDFAARVSAMLELEPPDPNAPAASKLENCVSVITAIHPQTVRVRVGTMYLMDFSYCEPAIFAIERAAALEWDGMLMRHPHLQLHDLLTPFCQPFLRAKVENIFYRWEKDHKRMMKLLELYPPGQVGGRVVFLDENGTFVGAGYSKRVSGSKPPAAGRRSLDLKHVNGWMGALAAYGKAIGRDWLGLEGASYALPADGGQPSDHEGLELVHDTLIYVPELPSEFRVPVGHLLPARARSADGAHLFTYGPEHFCTSPRSLACRDLELPGVPSRVRVVCCELLLCELLYHWKFCGCKSCGYYFCELWEAYSSGEHEVLYPSIDLVGDPRADSVLDYMLAHPQFDQRERPPNIHEGERVAWEPGELYHLDGHLVTGSASDTKSESSPIARGGQPDDQLPASRLVGVVVFGLSSCPYSREAQSIPGALVFMDEHRELARLRKALNWSTVPLIFEDGQFVGGLSDFKNKHPELSLGGADEPPVSFQSFYAHDHAPVPPLRVPDIYDNQFWRDRQLEEKGETPQEQFSEILFDDSDEIGSVNTFRSILQRLQDMFKTINPQVVSEVYSSFLNRVAPSSKLQIPRLPKDDNEGREARIAGNFVNKLKGLSVSRLLDVGAMDGLIAKKVGLSMRASKVYCLDIAPRDQEAGVTWISYDAQGKIPLESGHVDLVIMSQVLHHVPPVDRLRLLQEVRRVLAPRGVLLIKEHDFVESSREFEAFLNSVHYLYWKIYDEKFQELHPYLSKNELLVLFTKVGFYVDTVDSAYGVQKIYHATFTRERQV